MVAAQASRYVGATLAANDDQSPYAAHDKRRWRRSDSGSVRSAGAGVQHRGTDAEVSKGGKQRDRGDERHQPEDGRPGFAHDVGGIRESQCGGNLGAENAVDSSIGCGMNTAM
jgi:hypothetical protein